MAAPKAGGFKLSLAGAKSKPGFKAPLEKPAKRPRLNLGDDEPEDDNARQEITGWDAAEGGAVELNNKNDKDKGPRIIPSLPNRNWSEEAKKRAASARAAKPAEQNGDVPDEDEEKPKMSYGLTVFSKDNKENGSPEPMDTTDDSKPQDDGLTDEQRLEKNALDSLLNGKPANQHVIPVQTEEDTFHHDLHAMPDAPTFETYEAVPIEGFGAALLRGMGWKDGEGIGKDNKPGTKPKEIKRRPALLGIGAKEEAAVGMELGEWGKGRKKTTTTYNPIVLKNGATGEIISEEELKARLERQEMLHEEAEKQPRSKYDAEDEDRTREKRRERKDRDRRDDKDDYERRRDRDRRRDKDDEYSDRDRQRDRDRERDKKKYRDEYDYDDSDRRREKRRDDEYERRDKDRHRDRRRRSRSPDSDERREKRRERDRRERSRDRDDDSDRRKRRRDYDQEDERGGRKRRHRDEERSSRR